MLATEAKLNDLQPNQKQKVELAAGLKCHYRIPSLGQAVPLKIRLVTHMGVGFASLLISQAVERPSREMAEQIVAVMSRVLNVAFSGERRERFGRAWIYLTFESEREFASSLLVGFGKGKLGEIGKPSRSAKVSMIVKSEEENNEDKIRLDEILGSVPCGFKSPRHLRRKTSGEIMKHRVKVRLLKEEREGKSMRCKVLMNNKKRINELFEDILEKKLSEYKNAKKGCMLLITLIKLFKLARGMYKKQKLVKKGKEIYEEKLHKLRRIYIFIKSRLGLSFGERIRHKLGTYFTFAVVASWCLFIIRGESLH